MSLINTQVQPFKTEAFHNGKFITVTEESLKGKWSVVIFMPAAFTFNCPTEVEDAADNYPEFQKAGTEVYISLRKQGVCAVNFKGNSLISKRSPRTRLVIGTSAVGIR